MNEREFKITMFYLNDQLVNTDEVEYIRVPIKYFSIKQTTHGFYIIFNGKDYGYDGYSFYLHKNNTITYYCGLENMYHTYEEAENRLKELYEFIDKKEFSV